MKAVLVVSIVCLFALTAVRAQTYPADYDSLDIDALLSNEDKVKMFGACLLDDTVCTERALKLKGILLDAFQTKCSKCTEVQKGHIRKTVKFFIANRPEQWQKVVLKYDPEGKHAVGFRQFLQDA